jgi:hypothetical protein
MDLCFVCCKSRQKAKRRTIKTKKEVRIKYKENTKRKSCRRHWLLSIVGVVCCQKSLRLADPSPRGVLPTVI